MQKIFFHINTFISKLLLVVIFVGFLYAPKLKSNTYCDSQIPNYIQDPSYNCVNYGTSYVSACYSLILEGIELPVTSSGQYTALLTNAAGCDSFHTYFVTIHIGDTTSSYVTACDSISLFGIVNFVTSSGDFTAYFPNQGGCDSAHTYHVTMHYSDSTSSFVTACNIAYLDGIEESISSSGDYVVHYHNRYGCDSTHTYHVTISYGASGSSYVYGCDAVWVVGLSTPIYASGTYVISFPTSGCDSLHTYYVTLYTSTNGSSTIVACDDVNLEGVEEPIITSGIYTIHYTNAHGCDSVHVYDITILNSQTNTTLDTVCQSELPFMWRGQVVAAAGTYTDIETAANGCDSFIVLQVWVNQNPIATSSHQGDVSICQSTPLSLSVSIVNGALPYIITWIKDLEPMSETTPTIILDTPGNYHAVIADNNGCTDTTAITHLNVTGTLVTNGNNDGPGSLRKAISCADDSDIIAIDPYMEENIVLTQELHFDKSITFGESTFTKNIVIDFTSIGEAGIIIDPNKIVVLQNLNFHQINNTENISLIEIRGHATFKNILSGDLPLIID